MAYTQAYIGACFLFYVYACLFRPDFSCRAVSPCTRRKVFSSSCFIQNVKCGTSDGYGSFVFCRAAQMGSWQMPPASRIFSDEYKCMQQNRGKLSRGSFLLHFNIQCKSECRTEILLSALRFAC